MATRTDIEIIEAERPEEDTPETWRKLIAQGLRDECRQEAFFRAEFVECDTCARKPGSPPLCAGCLANRNTIEDLRALLAKK